MTTETQTETLKRLMENKELYKELLAVVSTYIPPVESFSKPQKREDLIHHLLLSIGLRMLIIRNCKCRTCRKHSRFDNLFANAEITLDNCSTVAEMVLGEEIRKL